jgi:hypothetical protein
MASDLVIPSCRLSVWTISEGTVIEFSKKVPKKRTVVGEPQPVVIASSVQDQCLVVLAEVEKARQFIRRGGSGVAAVAFLLG